MIVTWCVGISFQRNGGLGINEGKEKRGKGRNRPSQVKGRLGMNDLELCKVV